MSLLKIKKLLNFDQQNILSCEIIQDFDTHSTIRTPTGKVFRAEKQSSVTFDVGDQVEVRTDKRYYTVIGVSPYAPYAAEKSTTL
jgi:hypothetical protein